MIHPAATVELQSLFYELKQLDQVSSAEYEGRKYRIIHELAEGQYYEAKSYFVKGLESSDPDYRYACISALTTHWRDADEEIIAGLLRIAQTDPENMVRLIAVDSLGILRIQDAFSTLQKIAENKKESVQLRETAYNALLNLPRPPAKNSVAFDLSAEGAEWLKELETLDKQNAIEMDSKCDLILKLGEARFYQASSYLAAGLKHPDPDYRSACLHVLTLPDWTQKVDVTPQLKQIAEDDPDKHVQRIAKLALERMKNKKTR